MEVGSGLDQEGNQFFLRELFSKGFILCLGCFNALLENLFLS